MIKGIQMVFKSQERSPIAIWISNCERQDKGIAVKVVRSTVQIWGHEMQSAQSLWPESQLARLADLLTMHQCEHLATLPLQQVRTWQASGRRGLALPLWVTLADLLAWSGHTWRKTKKRGKGHQRWNVPLTPWSLKKQPRIPTPKWDREVVASF